MGEWATKEWLNEMFDKDEHPDTDGWKISWRGSQSIRHKECIKLLKKHNILPASEINILDIGSALGDFTRKLYSYFNSCGVSSNSVFGIDVSSKAVSRSTEHSCGITFKEASVTDIPFDNDAFNLVTCLEVLYYLNHQDRKIAVDEIDRVLKSDGFFLFTVCLDGGQRYFSEDEIMTLINRKFVFVETMYLHSKFYHHIESQLMRILAFSEKRKLPFVKTVIKNILSWEFAPRICENISKFICEKSSRTLMMGLVVKK